MGNKPPETMGTEWNFFHIVSFAWVSLGMSVKPRQGCGGLWVNSACLPIYLQVLVLCPKKEISKLIQIRRLMVV